MMAKWGAKFGKFQITFLRKGRMKYVIDLNEVNLSNIHIVGGKNASTGEMIQNLVHLGVKTPGGFATTTEAFDTFLAQKNLNKKIIKLLSSIKSKNLQTLHKASAQIQRLILATPFMSEFE